MTVNRSNDYYLGVMQELRKLPAETEWFECKHNNDNPGEIGEYLSALANSAAFTGKTNAYLVWRVDNLSYDIISRNSVRVASAP